MHPTYPEDARELLDVTKKTLRKATKVSPILAPPALFLADLVKHTKTRTVQFAMQNVHWETAGAFTGEVSVLQAKASGAHYVIIGHAERRRMGETDEQVSKKVEATLATPAMKAIVCIGEIARNDDGAFLSELAEQLSIATATVAPEQLSRLIIAYEPVWAIGADSPMTPHEMHETAMYIRKLLVTRFDESALRVPVLYGGSIDITNIKTLSDAEMDDVAAKIRNAITT
jgi:triosephosphate isomerase